MIGRIGGGLKSVVLTALAQAPDEPGVLLATRRIAGRSLLSRQIDLAVRCRAGRVICVSEGPSRTVFEAQALAEAAGLRFHSVARAHDIPPLVSANDHVVVVAEGLLPGGDEFLAACEAPLVTTLHASADGDGFERIDERSNWAGLCSADGATVRRLSELPADVDIAASVLRLALQSGVPRQDLTSHEGRVRIGHGLPFAAQERDWIERNVNFAEFATPGRAVAQRFGARLARDIIGTRLERIFMGISLSLGGFSLLLAWLQSVPGALVLAAGSIFALHVHRTIAGLARGGHGGRESPLDAANLVLPDIYIVGALGLPHAADGLWHPAAFAVTLLLLRRILVDLDRAPFLQDRIALTMLLLCASIFGMSAAGSALLCLVACAVLLRERRVSAA